MDLFVPTSSLFACMSCYVVTLYVTLLTDARTRAPGNVAFHENGLSELGKVTQVFSDGESRWEENGSPTTDRCLWAYFYSAFFCKLSVLLLKRNIEETSCYKQQ